MCRSYSSPLRLFRRAVRSRPRSVLVMLVPETKHMAYHWVMKRIRPQRSEPTPSDRAVATDVVLREEPDEEEDGGEGDKDNGDEDDDDDNDDEGYSE